MIIGLCPSLKRLLENLLTDAEQLKDELDHKLEHLDQTTPEEWMEEAKHWARLYNKWHDRSALVGKILEVVADRTKHLIDKDIQVIQDYQTQLLAHIPQESETFRNLEDRLTHAIAEPLKQLISLRNQPREHTSLQQASEWVSNLQQQRESYFDQLLMKIDHVIKDVVYKEDSIDLSAFLEAESEIIFMERELHHINLDLSHIQLEEESERQFVLARLEGLLDHVDEVNEQALPLVLRQRIGVLKTGITLALSCLE